MDQPDDHRALSADLAALVAVSGRIFTLIRARTWDAREDPATAPEAIKDIMSWSDAAHNLSVLGHQVRASVTEAGADRARLQSDALWLGGAMEAVADRCLGHAPLVASAFREAAGLVSKVAELVGSAREDEGPGLDG
jgi:hypothetical protein